MPGPKGDPIWWLAVCVWVVVVGGGGGGRVGGLLLGVALLTLQ